MPGRTGGREIPAVYLVPFHRAERSLASGLLELLHAGQDRMAAFGQLDWDRALTWLRGRTGTDLAPEQEQAVRLALTQRVAVLTGGPGCGKSFTVRSIVELARAKKAKIVLVAPTGRAAKRLAELTDHEATTVHRLLQLQPGGDPKYDRDNPLDADLVVADESSMIDLILANKLVKAVPPGAHLLLVGDVDQLPSVGAGEVLRDLLAAPDVIPRVRLTKIFRQAQQSGIVVNAHRVNAAPPARLSRLLLVHLRGHRTDGRPDGRHRGSPHPAPLRPGPAPRHPGAGADAPGAGRCGQSQHPPAGNAHPAQGREPRTPLRQPRVPGR